MEENHYVLDPMSKYFAKMTTSNHMWSRSSKPLTVTVFIVCNKYFQSIKANPANKRSLYDDDYPGILKRFDECEIAALG